MHAAIARGAKALVAATALLALSALAAEPPPATNATAPASADVRPTSYNVEGALAIGTDSGYVFQSCAGPVRLDVGSVANESTTVTSGSIRVALVVTTTPDPNAATYWVIAHTDLGPLAPGQRVGPLSATADYFTPPNGTYYLHMAVFEYEPTTCTAPSGYCLDDYVTFQHRVQVVNGQIYDAGPAPGAQALAVEYYHVAFNHYFITAFPNEIDLLDRGMFSGWARLRGDQPGGRTAAGDCGVFACTSPGGAGRAARGTSSDTGRGLSMIARVATSATAITTAAKVASLVHGCRVLRRTTGRLCAGAAVLGNWSGVYVDARNCPPMRPKPALRPSATSISRS